MTMLPMGGIFGSVASQLPSELPMPKQGMFGGAPNWVNAIQAAVGGYLQGRGAPGGNALLQQVYGQRMMAQQEAMRQQQRQDDFADWQQKEQWKLENAGPANNDTINDFNFIRDQLGEDAAKQYLRNLGDPMVTATFGNRVYSGPRSQLGTVLGGGAAPQGPVGKLTPIDEDGGPVPSAPGMFPRPY